MVSVYGIDISIEYLYLYFDCTDNITSFPSRLHFSTSQTNVTTCGIMNIHTIYPKEKYDPFAMANVAENIDTETVSKKNMNTTNNWAYPLND